MVSIVHSLADYLVFCGPGWPTLVASINPRGASRISTLYLTLGQANLLSATIQIFVICRRFPRITMLLRRFFVKERNMHHAQPNHPQPLRCVVHLDPRSC